MKKRIVSMLLAVMLLVSLLPVSAAAMSTEEQARVYASAEQAVKSYGQKVHQVGCDESALADFLYHGFFGKGKKMNIKESDPVVSTMFNSLMMQEALAQAITNGIRYMNEMNSDVILVTGSTSWHNYYDNYSFRGYLSEQPQGDTYTEWVIAAMDIYGEDRYIGPKNDYDTAMYLIAGDMSTDILIKRTEVKNGTAVYQVEVTVDDEFDFDTGYDGLKEAGYDTAKDQKLIQMGKLLTYMGLDEFKWSYAISFRIEAPYECDHVSKNYHWTYDAANRTMTSHVSDEFSENKAQQRNTRKNAERDCFKIDEPIVLRHDAAWEMEYKMYSIDPVIINGKSNTGHSNFYFYTQGKGDYKVPMLIAAQIEYSSYDTKSNSWEDSIRHYAASQAEYNKNFVDDHIYVIHLENRIDKNGNNMIWGSIYDETDAVYMLPNGPLDNYYWLKDGEYGNGNCKTNRVNGADFYLSYIADINNPLPEGFIEMSVWENGKGEESRNNFTSKATSADCTNAAKVIYTCRDCGYSYTETLSPALGHSFGAYVYDNNASCTADGTQTRKCTVCGVGETVTAPDTAKGHDYKAAVTEPTYEQQGYTTYTCAVCGDSYKDDYTAVKKHSYVGVVTEPTCIAQGYTTYTCSECGDSYVDDYTDLVDHTPVIDPYVAPTCVEKGKMEGSHCGVCGYVIKKQALISTTDTHRMEESVVKMPTYDEPGQVAYICQDCGKTDYVEVPPLTKPTPKNPFTDVSESDWFYEPVLWAVQEGVTGGKTETTFAPNEGCTRAQVVTFLWAANGKPEPVNTNNPFSDIGESDWCYNAVLWAVEKGITTGVSATEFGPEQTCTRAQIVTFLYAAMNKPEISGTSTFADVADGDWFTKPVIWAAENEVTGGIGGGMFGPNQTCTRAQVVTFLNKVYNK